MKFRSDINGALARILRRTRRSTGMTRMELAAAAGLSEQDISKMERGAGGVSLSALFSLSRAFHLTAADLVRLIEKEAGCAPAPPIPGQGKPAKTEAPAAMETGTDGGARGDGALRLRGGRRPPAAKHPDAPSPG